mgnify:CR=1 FL=1
MPGKERTYNIEGVELPSVTTVLNIIEKPWLSAWQKKEMGGAIRTELMTADLPKDDLERMDFLDEIIKESKKIPALIGKEAMSLGTKIHEAIHDYSTGRYVEITDDIKIGLASFKLWRQESGMTLLEAERVVYDKELGYAGTADAIFQDNLGRKFIIDYKTSSSGIVSDSYALQVAAYGAAYPDVINGGFIIMLNKSGKPNFKIHRVNLDECFEGFINCLELYKKMKGGDLWIQ